MYARETKRMVDQIGTQDTGTKEVTRQIKRLADAKIYEISKEKEKKREMKKKGL